MRPFYSKDDRLIVPRIHIVDFTGKNNSSKGKVLIILLYFKGRYLSARMIHNETGVNYNYLRQRLSFWYNIRYVNRKVVVPTRGRPKWAYCIAERGERFVNDRIPPEKREEYTIEINQWRAKDKK